MTEKRPRHNAFGLIRPYFAENRQPIFWGVVCLITVDGLQLCIPRVVKRAVDDLTAFAARGPELARYAMVIVGLALLIGLFRYIWRRCLIGTSRRIEEGLRNRLFSHVQTLSAGYFNRTRTGDLMAHATNDINHVRMATGMGMVALTDAVVMGTAAVAFMAYIHLSLTLLVMIPMPLIVFGTRFFSRRMHHRYRDVQAGFSDLTEAAREGFAGIRVVKAYNRQAHSAQRFSALSGEYVQRNMRLVRVTGSFFPMMMMLANLSQAIVLYVGGRRTIFADITPGDFVAFISYLAMLTWPMMAMGWVTNLIQRGKASLERIQRILETRPEIVRDPNAAAVTEIRGAIAFQGVHLAYGGSAEAFGGTESLSAIDLAVAPGRTLGLVGPPGSGKSSLVGLIPRLFDVSGGTVRIDGHDVRRMRLEDLRRAVAFMPQEPFLFSGTIRENIVMDRDDVDDARLAEAVATAALTDTVAALADGFETVVGERGVVLSGGQRQRIALARALLCPAPILILDDPISQVDVETAGAVIKGLRKAGQRRTVLIVSHRLAAVRHADRIVVLEQGRIREAGTHEQLVNAGGYYAATFRLQQIEETFGAP